MSAAASGFSATPRTARPTFVPRTIQISPAAIRRAATTISACVATTRTPKISKAAEGAKSNGKRRSPVPYTTESPYTGTTSRCRHHQRGKFRCLGAAQTRVSNRVSITMAIHARRIAPKGQSEPDAQTEGFRSPQRRERTECEINAIGQVDHAQHPEHHREAKREEGVGRAKDEAVHELLLQHLFTGRSV